MPIIDLYESSEHRNNVAHFAAIVNIALVDGELNLHEEILVKQFANKLDITEEEYEFIFENPKKYPIYPPSSTEMRLRRLYDLFRIIYADHEIDEKEQITLLHYAIGLGFTSDRAEIIIKKSQKIFNGELDFEDYKYIIDK